MAQVVFVEITFCEKLLTSSCSSSFYNYVKTLSFYVKYCAIVVVFELGLAKFFNIFHNPFSIELYATLGLLTGMLKESYFWL